MTSAGRARWSAALAMAAVCAFAVSCGPPRRPELRQGSQNYLFTISSDPIPPRAREDVIYTIVVRNEGPNAANNAVVRDPVALGLSCTTNPTCSATGATCPVAPSIAALQGAGLISPSLPNGGVVTFTLTCTVTATGF